MQSIFFEIGFIIVLATILGGVAKYLRQPLVLAYILTGIFVKLLGFTQVGAPETLTYFSHLGIAFLLFIVGLELNPKELLEMGKKSLVIGIMQVVITFLLGFLLSVILGFSLLPSFFLAISLTFSSTIIVVKLLIEKNDLNSLYGRMSVAILLLQDVVAVLVLIFLSGLAGDGVTFWTFVLTIVKAIIFFSLVYLFAKEVLQGLFEFLSNSPELLFLGGVAWCLFLAGLANFAGFSLEIGAFLAGISLASTKYRMEMTTKIKPLRDFFVTIFFVVLGIDISFSSLGSILPYVLIFTIFVVLIKPFVIFFIMSKSGYNKRVSFLSGNILSQVSEFSLIVAAIGFQIGKINSEVSSIIILVAVITIVISSYLSTYDDRIYKKIKKTLEIFTFSKKNVQKTKEAKEYVDHVILIGCHRMGFDLIAAFDKLEIPFVVLDFDPKVIKQLEGMGIECLFGDIGDPEILEEINLDKARMVISTVPNFQDNLAIIDEVKRMSPTCHVWLTASQVNEAFRMYQLGADYVILPHLLGGQYVSSILRRNWNVVEYFDRLKEKHMSDLIKRKEMGHL